MKRWWWKILCIVLLAYALTAGMLITVPDLPVMGETTRNIFYHVGMWVAMMTTFAFSVVHSIIYLRNNKLKHDIAARSNAGVGIVFGLLGYATGAVWAAYTWADPNKSAFESFSTIARDPKLIGAAMALLIYLAYLILRDSIQDIDKKARVSAVYNIFAFAMLFPTILIVPRILPSLHPGQEGNPAINPSDSTTIIKLVQFPAFLGWALLGIWIAKIKTKLGLIKEQQLLQ